ncbi:MAG: hypothetical protein ABIT08_09925 [Bacteroidia bacterium]
MKQALKTKQSVFYAAVFVELSHLKNEIENRISGIKDLQVPFTEHLYYYHHFAGKFSLKNILHVLCPDFSGYENLKIQNGTM